MIDFVTRWWIKMLSCKVCRSLDIFLTHPGLFLVGTKFVAHRVCVLILLYIGISLKQLFLRKIHAVVPFRLAKRSLTRGLKDKMSLTSLSHNTWCNSSADNSLLLGRLYWNRPKRCYNIISLKTTNFSSALSEFWFRSDEERRTHIKNLFASCCGKNVYFS